jgi:hypothetical protein
MRARRLARVRVVLSLGFIVLASGPTVADSGASLPSDARGSNAGQAAPVLMLDRRSGRRLPFPRIRGYRYPNQHTTVYAVVDDGKGGWYIGGSFESVGGLACRNLAHVLQNGRVDRRWCLNPSSAVRALERTRTTLYIGGEPASPFIANHVANLAAVDVETQRLTSWEPTFDASFGYVLDIDVKESIVYVVSEGFRTLDAITGKPTLWNPHEDIDPRGGARKAVAFGSVEYLWGDLLDRVGSARRCDLAAVSARTGRPTPWNPRPRCTQGGEVTDLQLHGNRLFVSGLFSQIAGAKQAGLASFNAANGKLTSWRPQVGRAGIAAFAKYGETVYVSAFVSRRDESLLYAIDARTGKKAGWHVRLDARPEIIQGDSRSLLIGGDALQLLRP